MGLTCSCNQRSENETGGEILSIQPEQKNIHDKNALSSDQVSVSSLPDLSHF